MEVSVNYSYRRILDPVMKVSAKYSYRRIFPDPAGNRRAIQMNKTAANVL